MVAGNTRIAGCFSKDVDIKIWVVDLNSHYTKVDAEVNAEKPADRKEPQKKSFIERIE